MRRAPGSPPGGPLFLCGNGFERPGARETLYISAQLCKNQRKGSRTQRFLLDFCEMDPEANTGCKTPRFVMKRPVTGWMPI